MQVSVFTKSAITSMPPQFLTYGELHCLSAALKRHGISLTSPKLRRSVSYQCSYLHCNVCSMIDGLSDNCVQLSLNGRQPLGRNTSIVSNYAWVVSFGIEHAFRPGNFDCTQINIYITPSCLWSAKPLFKMLTLLRLSKKQKHGDARWNIWLEMYYFWTQLCWQIHDVKRAQQLVIFPMCECSVYAYSCLPKIIN